MKAGNLQALWPFVREALKRPSPLALSCLPGDAYRAIRDAAVKCTQYSNRYQRP